jgi:hypothetical protein
MRNIAVESSNINNNYAFFSVHYYMLILLHHLYGDQLETKLGLVEVYGVVLEYFSKTPILKLVFLIYIDLKV